MKASIRNSSSKKISPARPGLPPSSRNMGANHTIWESVRKTFFQILLLCSGYFLLLPPLLFVVAINEILRYLINFFLNHNTPYLLAKGGRKTIPYTGEMEGRGAGLCFLASDPEDVNVEDEASWISSRLFSSTKGKGAFDILKSTFTTRYGYCATKRIKDFDIRKHIYIWRDSTTEIVEEKELLQDIIPSLMHPFVGEVKPPWEWVIVPKVRFQGQLQTIRVLRIHWAYGDGYSLFCLLSSLLEWKGSENGRKEVPFVFNPWKTLTLGQRLQIWWVWTKAFLRLPLELAKNVFLGEEELLGKKDPFSKDARPQPLSSYKYWISPEFEVSILKNCAKSLRLDTTSTTITAYRNAVGRVCLEKNLIEKDCNRLAYCTSILLPCERKWGLENQTFEIEEEIPLLSLEPVKGKSAEERMGGIWWRCLENWLDRMPCFVMRKVLNSSFYEDVKVSTYLANAPFTREKGRWRGKSVNALGFFEADGTPISITAISCSYGNGFRVYSSVNPSLGIAEHMDLVFKYFEEELKCSFRKPATA